jgi:serine/threonine protein kinase
MEHFAGATTLNEKYDIDQAQLLGRGKLSVVHRTRRHACLPSARRYAPGLPDCSLPAPDPELHDPPADSRRADGQLVVLKKIEVFEMGKTERYECMNELGLLRQMKHPHIISYLDCVLEVRALPLSRPR